MQSFAIKGKQFWINGENAHLLAGEMPYYRVDPAYWDRCLDSAKAMKLNAISFYVPWIVHEYEEDKFDFDGSINPRFNLKLWLDMLKRKGLYAIVRPGPYVYNETLHDGIPSWFVTGYPQARAMRWDGHNYRSLKDAISYLHPDVLRRVKIWYENVAMVLKDYLYSKGGPIIFIQLDNEVPGIHEWRGGADQNPETMGYGKRDGLFPSFLRQKYGDIEKMNSAYETAFHAFEQISPDKVDINSFQWNVDEKEFYYEYYVPRYFDFLYRTLKNCGIDCFMDINAASPDYVFCLMPSARQYNDVLLGVDLYYSIHKSRTFDSLTLSFDCEYGYEILNEAYDGPEVSLEFQAGVLHDYPRVYAPHIYLWYAWSLIEGFKGLNGFNTTGGYNPQGMGSMETNIHYQAPITYRGEFRDTYFAIQKAYKMFGHDHWLLNSSKVYDIALGMIDDSDAYQQLAHLLFNFNISYKILNIRQRTIDELLKYNCLWVCSEKVMDTDIQQKLVDYVMAGGKLVVSGTLPIRDKMGCKTDLLQQRFDILMKDRHSRQPKVVVDGIEYYTGSDIQLPRLLTGNGWDTLAHDMERRPAIVYKKMGRGKVVILGFNIHYAFQDQKVILDTIFKALEVKPYIVAGNDVRVIARQGCDGVVKAFVINYHPTAVHSDVYINDCSYSLSLQPYDIVWFNVL